MAAKDFLKAKIDNKEAWIEADRAFRGANRDAGNEYWHYARPYGIRSSDMWTVNDRWWGDREAARCAFLYEPPPHTLIGILNAFGSSLICTYPHPSQEDPTMLAYTASDEDGRRDKQTRSTIGRWLRRFVVGLSDAYIQRVEQEWRAELDPNFNVATTPEDIEYVYTHMSGDTGCMRHDKSHFNLNIHPSAVYASPGMGVAYVGEIGDAVVSRAVVWVNPEDENDKRFVRVYGSPHLRKKLERAGYREADLSGAKLRVIATNGSTPTGTGPHALVMPYLDGPGGDQGRRDGAYGVWDEADPDYIRILKYADASALSSAGIDIQQLKLTRGSITMTRQRLADMTFVCAVSGGSYNKLHGYRAVEVLLPNGTTGVAEVGQAAGYEAVSTIRDGCRVTIRAASATLAEHAIWAAGLYWHKAYLDEFVRMGELSKLDEELYPGLTDRYVRYSNAAICNITQKTVRVEDTVTVAHVGLVYRGAVEGKTGKGGEYIRLHNLSATGKLFIERSRESEIHTTPSGRKVLLTRHDVVCTFGDRTADFRRNVAHILPVFGREYGVTEAILNGSEMVPEASMRLAFDDYASTLDSRSGMEHLVGYARFSPTRTRGIYIYGGRVRTASYAPMRGASLAEAVTALDMGAAFVLDNADVGDHLEVRAYSRDMLEQIRSQCENITAAHYWRMARPWIAELFATRFPDETFPAPWTPDATEATPASTDTSVSPPPAESLSDIRRRLDEMLA